ncbi:MAG TPA: hypothetical protein VFM54_09250 [Micromonosporaceae bacterium]|nr:hypothetical protein [Micromonosporaceae bacterium]
MSVLTVPVVLPTSPPRPEPPVLPPSPPWGPRAYLLAAAAMAASGTATCVALWAAIWVDSVATLGVVALGGHLVVATLVAPRRRRRGRAGRPIAAAAGGRPAGRAVGVVHARLVWGGAGRRPGVHITP